MKYLIIFACLVMTACAKNEKVADTPLQSVNIEAGGLKFSNGLNLTMNTVSQVGETINIMADAHTDLFCDPKGMATNTTAPVLFTEIDNTKPFTFTVKVAPQFTKNGTYSAGALLAFIDKNHWQKLCYEQDEEGKQRIVTVRTEEFSDDNNHEAVDSTSVYLRMSSDTEVIGNYYSENGKDWHLVRIYKNIYPDILTLGLSSQSPKDDRHECTFSDIDCKPKAVSDFRVGSLE